jgi:choline-sulfatase
MALARPFGDRLPRSNDLRAQVALYDADVLATDQAIGGFLGWLDAQGLREDTVVVVTADHGEEFFDHGGTGHGQQYAELLRVPLVMDHPGLRAHAVRVVDAPTPSVDVVPTLLDLLGLAPDPLLPGVSRVPAMASEVPPPRLAFSGTAHGPGVRAAVWSETHHLVVQDGERRLFDAVTDPRETMDIAPAIGDGSPGLSRELDGWLAGLQPAAAWEPVELDALTEEQLRALGYLR